MSIGFETIKAAIENASVTAPDEPTPDDYSEFEAALQNVTMNGHKEQSRRDLFNFFRLDGEPLADLATPIGEVKRAMGKLNRSQLKLLQDNLAGFFFDRPNFRRAYPDGYELSQAPDPCPPFGTRPGAFNLSPVGPANIHHRIARVARALGVLLGQITTRAELLAHSAKLFSDYGVIFQHFVDVLSEDEIVRTSHRFVFRNIENPDECQEFKWESAGESVFDASMSAVAEFLQVTFLVILPIEPIGLNSSSNSPRRKMRSPKREAMEKYAEAVVPIGRALSSEVGS